MKILILIINLLFILCSCYNQLNDGLHFVTVLSFADGVLTVKEDNLSYFTVKAYDGAIISFIEDNYKEYSFSIVVDDGEVVKVAFNEKL